VRLSALRNDVGDPMKRNLWLLALATTFGGAARGATTGITLTPAEQADVEQRLHDFYDGKRDPAVMSRPVPKYDAFTGAVTHPNPVLRQNLEPGADPLQQQAGVKASDDYQRYNCSAHAMRHFETPPCRPTLAPMANIDDDNDAFEDLVDSWVDD